MPISLLANLPWRAIGIAVAAWAIFLSGCEYGETRIQSAWNAEKAIQQEAVASQAIKVAEHAKAAQSINSGVSDYVQARRASISGVNYAGLRQSSSNGTLPRVSFGASGTAPTAESCVPSTDYNQLAADAADDALIMLAWQKWYDGQSEAWEVFLKKQPEGRDG